MEKPLAVLFLCTGNSARDLVNRIRLWMSLPIVGSRIKSEGDSRAV